MVTGEEDLFISVEDDGCWDRPGTPGDMFSNGSFGWRMKIGARCKESVWVFRGSSFW